MADRVTRLLKFDDAQLIFCNFSGRPSKFKPAGGVQEFNVVLTPEEADILKEEGWNVKEYVPRNAEPEDGPIAYLPVGIRFDVYPPNIWLVTSRNKTRLDEERVKMLDSMLSDFERVDITVRPYNWENARGENGIKAYVKNMYVTIAEDEFYDRYADIPESSPNEDDC